MAKAAKKKLGGRNPFYRGPKKGDRTKTGKEAKQNKKPGKGKTKSQKADRARDAKRPGYRKNRWGKVYYENRENRSDTRAQRKTHGKTK